VAWEDFLASSRASGVASVMTLPGPELVRTKKARSLEVKPPCGRSPTTVLLNVELERMWMEAVLVLFEILS
jgi:hypothetical protein